MKKYIYPVSLIVLLIALFSLAVYIVRHQFPSFGAPIITYNASSTVNASVVCNGATSTQIVAGSSGRLYFSATVASSTNITLCKASICTSGSGLTINANGGSYEQKIDDHYVGPWSCIGAGASSTIGVIYAQ